MPVVNDTNDDTQRTARSTSRASPSWTSQMTSSVAGLIVLKVRPDTELTNCPLMKRRVSILLFSIVILGLLLDKLMQTTKQSDLRRKQTPAQGKRKNPLATPKTSVKKKSRAAADQVHAVLCGAEAVRVSNVLRFLLLHE
jgi:hypothetical protein